MSVLNRVDLISDISGTIYTNTQGLINGNKLKTRLINLAESSLNKTTDADIAGGYLKIDSSGKVDVSFIKAASATGKFLRDDGTWQTVSGGGGSSAFADITGNASDNTSLVSYITGRINSLIASAPSALDTLNELAASLGNDANFASTVTSALAGKAPVNNPSLTGTVTLSGLAGNGDKMLVINNSGVVSYSTIPTVSFSSLTGSASDNSSLVSYVSSAVSALVASAPSALDTLNELAAALGNDSNFASTVTTSLAGKAPVNNPTLTGTLTLSALAGNGDKMLVINDSGVVSFDDVPSGGSTSLTSTYVGFGNGSNAVTGSNKLTYDDTNGYLNLNGYMYIGGSTSPTARLHLAAGTTTAGTAPIKFTSGSLLTTSEVGAVEFLTDNLFLTITTGASRKAIVLSDTTLTSGRIPTVTTNGRLTDSANFQFSTFDVGNGGRGIYLNQATPSSTNFIVGHYSSFGGVTVFNAPTGLLCFRIANGANVISSNYTDGFWNCTKIALGAANTATAAADLAASTTSRSSLRIRSGTAPTSPNDGDVWYDGTNLYFRNGGTTKTFNLT